MPLIKSGSKQAISTNIREMMAAGHPRNQSIAAALDTARRYGKKYAEGGDVDPYETKLSSRDEGRFAEWKRRNAPKDSGADYDLRGAFKAGLTPAANGHWPDTFKKPNHPTFSDQSIYAKQSPELAGSWNGDTFIPPAMYAEGGDVEDDPIDPFSGMPITPSPQAQTKFEKIAGAIGSGLKQWVEAPGRAMEQVEPQIPGKITEADVFQDDLRRKQMREWGAGTALGMVGMGRLPGAAPEGAVGIGGGRLKSPEIAEAPKSEPFYSAVEQAVKNAKDEKASPQRWLNTIKNSNQVKAEEMDWMGLPDWLAQQKGPLTKDQIADYIRANKTDIVEKMYGEGPEVLQARKERDTASEAFAKANNDFVDAANNGAPPRERVALQEKKEQALLDYQAASNRLRDIGSDTVDPKYSQYSLPGMSPNNRSHRELLLRLPDREHLEGDLTAPPAPAGWAHTEDDGLLASDPSRHNSNYYNTHYPESNILAHVRTTDRNIDGKKTLFIEELQSDWHQAGNRHGYLKPSAELNKLRDKASQLRDQVGAIDKEAGDLRKESKKTEEWLHEEIGAVLDGRESSNAPGYSHEQAVAQWQRLHQLMEGRSSLMAELDDINRSLVQFGKVPDAPFKSSWQKLAMKRMVHYAAEHGYDAIGWAPAEVHIGRWGENTASGMIHSYDKVMPDIMTNIGKKYGTKVEKQIMDTHARDPYPEGINVHHMALPEQMKSDVMKYGFPLFKRGGETEETKMAGGGFNASKWIPRPPNLMGGIRPVGGGMPRAIAPKASPGLIHSTIPGRTDKIPRSVPGGSYIIPASVVSGMGQGNTLAGADALNKLFAQGPYGDKMQKFGTPKPNFGHPMHMTAPQMRMPKPAKAGGVEEGSDHVPIIVAGGEYQVPPEVVQRLGNGNMKQGHKILDELVMHIRRQTIKDMRKEKPPKR